MSDVVATFAVGLLAFLAVLSLLALVADAWDSRRTSDSRGRNQARPWDGSR